MKEYETVMVFRPDGSETQSTQLFSKLSSIIEKNNGKIFQQKVWGKRELAYPINKHKQGVYHYFHYASEPTVVAELERSLKLNDLSIRYLTVKMADKVDVEAKMKELSVESEEKEAPKVIAKNEVSVQESKEEVANG